MECAADDARSAATLTAFDPRVGDPDNGRVLRPTGRFTSLLLSAAVLISTSGLAPLHLHEFDGADSHAILHSHFAAHHVGSHDTDKPEVEAADHVIWLETSSLNVLPFQFVSGAAVLVRVLEPVVLSRSWAVIAVAVNAPAHGPPRSAVSLRAPPPLPV